MSAPLPKIAFRAVTAGDLAFLAELYRTTRWDELAPSGWPDAEKRAFLQQQFALQTKDWARNYPDARRQIVLVDRAPAGRLYVDRRTASREICVVDIALLPAFRGRGIGTRLLQGVIAEADRDGFITSLHVDQHNPARRLYGRLGFAPVRNVGFRLLMHRAAAAGPGTPAAASAAPAGGR